MTRGQRTAIARIISDMIKDLWRSFSVPLVLPPRLGELADLLMQDVELGKREDYAAHLLEVNKEVGKLYDEATKGMGIDEVAY